MLNSCQIWITWPQTQHLVNVKRSCTFLKNEAVIKMIIKGRSPMMRHVSRTHRVALDGLFDRINLEPQDPNQTCWHQKPARRLVNQRKFHAWWWCNLLRLFNLMNSSMFSHSRFRSIEKANTMSKRIQERKTGEEPAVAKPRSTCLMSRNLLNEKQLSSLGSDASSVPENAQLDSESVLGGTRELARNKDQNPATCPQERNEDNPQQRGDVCESSGGCGKLQRGVDNPLERTRLDYHNMQISDSRYVEKVFENLRQKFRLCSCTLDAKTSVLIWGLFMSTTM